MEIQEWKSEYLYIVRNAPMITNIANLFINFHLCSRPSELIIIVVGWQWEPIIHNM